MRLASFEKHGRLSWGAITPDGIIDLGAAIADQGQLTLGQAIASGAMGQLAALVAANKGSEIPLDAVNWLPVITDPGQILCIGLNYDEHVKETRRERASHPTVFARFARCQVGHEAPVLRPRESTMLDFEGELAIIIGKAGRRVEAAEALDYIAGYACYNDVSVRDFQRHTTQFHPGKNFPATGAFGPWMVTTDEIADYTLLRLETRLNGVVVQSAGLDQMIFSIPELIAYCSTFTELLPGDVIVTGTPGGVGSARQPPLWMKAGDVVEVDIPGVGLLRNPVRDEAASAG